MRLTRTLRGLLAPATTFALLTISANLAQAQVTAAANSKTVPADKRGNHTGASDASAGRSADVYVKVQPVKGQQRVIRCLDGMCTIGNLAPGKYMVSLCDASGTDVAAEAAMTYSVISPRDAASGMASGKRQHSPMTITKEWNRALPENMIDVAEGGSTLDLQLKATINTTRSNIKRFD